MFPIPETMHRAHAGAIAEPAAKARPSTRLPRQDGTRAPVTFSARAVEAVGTLRLGARVLAVRTRVARVAEAEGRGLGVPAGVLGPHTVATWHMRVPARPHERQPLAIAEPTAPLLQLEHRRARTVRRATPGRSYWS
mgnify:CR=1 FL=1